jgi:hypothetical protein
VLKVRLKMQVNNEFKQEMNKYRDYMKSLSNFKRAQACPPSIPVSLLVMISTYIT